MEEPDEIEVIESRITAGTISDMVGLKEIERVGYLEYIAEVIRKEEEKFSHSLEFYTDVNTYIYDILVIENDNTKRLFKLDDVNKALTKEGFYVANFSKDADFNKLHDIIESQDKGYIFGTGDLYEEKKISLEDRIKIPRIRLPKDFVLTNN